jgi:hypothetical protein
MMLRIAFSLAVILAGALFVPVAAVPLGTALPDCTGMPVVRPAEIILACGDANAVARKLRWTGWGEPFAAATGTLSLNDCTPYCAAGKFHDYPIVLIARGSQRCPGGRRAYATVQYAFLGRSPYPNGIDTPIPFHCGPRR